MSIHFFLSSDASKVSLKRSSYNKISRKHDTENLGSYLIDYVRDGSVELPFCDDEMLMLRAFIDEQENQIEQAYEQNALLGMYGGLPIISRDAKYNRQFVDLPGYQPRAAKGQFLGVIHCARKLKLSNRKDLFNDALEELMQKSRMTDLALEIISNEILHITKLAEKDENTRGNNCLQLERAAQLLEFSELLNRFTTMTVKKEQLRELNKVLVKERVEKVFENLASDINTASLGTAKRIGDADLVINQAAKRDRRKQAYQIARANKQQKTTLGDVAISQVMSFTKPQTSLQL